MPSSPLRPARDLPHALTRYDRLAAGIGDRRIAFFLDFDGTLTPIPPRPELGRLSESARAVLTRLVRSASVAVVSGRDRAVLERLVAIDGVSYAGSHGFDIAMPGGCVFNGCGDFLAPLDRLETRLRQGLAAFPESQMERKACALAVHTRRVPTEPARAAVRDIVTACLAEEPQMTVTEGKMVYEILPAIDWHKGKAITWLLAAQGQGLEAKSIVPLFFGDDANDEPAFRTIRGHGIGIIVAPPDEDRLTTADYRVDDPGQVIELLRRWTLSGWRRSC
ncbi:MAG: trehalose-phosphatase [Alphaproteobacteria bacterium]|nr:trehalose-phosphatase [Alphaproteobacteria bacterium]